MWVTYMESFTVEYVVTIIATLFASSGFWAFVEYKLRNRSKSDADQKNQSLLLLGLAHDRIIYLGCAAIERGSITLDDYENLREYLYTPYQAMGGNGSVAKIMNEVDKLPTIIRKISKVKGVKL